MNRIELVTAVKSYVNRPNLVDSDISTMIASVEGKFNRLFREHPRNHQRSQYTQLADDPILLLPEDIETLITLRSGKNNVWIQASADFAFELGQVGVCQFIERGNCLELYQPPSEDTVFTIDYIAFLRGLVGDLDTNWISEYYADLYLYGVLTESAVFVKDDARMTLWKNEFETRMLETLLQGWNQNLAAAPQIQVG